MLGRPPSPQSGLLAEAARAHTELGAEDAIKIGYVAETAVERNVQDFRRLRRKLQRRFTQA